MFSHLANHIIERGMKPFRFLHHAGNSIEIRFSTCYSWETYCGKNFDKHKAGIGSAVNPRYQYPNQIAARELSIPPKPTGFM